MTEAKLTEGQITLQVPGGLRLPDELRATLENAARELKKYGGGGPMQLENCGIYFSCDLHICLERWFS